MIIQLNTDNHIDGYDDLSRTVTAQLEHSLERFASHITRIEVHFRDENGARGAPADKSCLLEARLKGEDPVAVKDKADTIPAALNGARDKLVHLLTKHYDKKRPPKGQDPFDTVTTL
jgi:ribosome-associated translation inhibitor RaiA